MRRGTTVLAAATFTVLLSACGTNNIADSSSFTTPAVQPATATALPATATQTSVPTPTATAQVQGAMVLFSADPMNAGLIQDTTRAASCWSSTTTGRCRAFLKRVDTPTTWTGGPRERST